MCSHSAWCPTNVIYGRDWVPKIAASPREWLAWRSSQFVDSTGSHGSVQAISIAPDGTVVGVSDPRHGGSAGIEGEPLPPPRRPDMARR